MSNAYTLQVNAVLTNNSIANIERQLNKGIDISINAKMSSSSQKSLSHWNNTIKNAKGNLNDYNVSWMQMLRSATKYRIASLPFVAMTTAAREAKDAIIDFDAALTEFKKVSDLSGDSLNDYTQKLGDLGSTVARTR